MRLAALHLYPVKSCGALSPAQARLDELGLESDRRYAILGASADALTQRDLPLMATIRPSLHDGGLALNLGGLAELQAPADAFVSACEADVWGRRIPARAAATTVNADLSAFLGAPARLVELDPAARRSFADSQPVLVVTTASLQALNAALDRPVGMERFRGNLVIEAAAPLAELDWRRLEVGEAELAFAEPCERCEVPSIDQASGARRGDELLQTLAARFGNVFGAYCRVSRPGRVAVGDAVCAT